MLKKTNENNKKEEFNRILHSVIFELDINFKIPISEIDANNEENIPFILSRKPNIHVKLNIKNKNLSILNKIVDSYDKNLENAIISRIMSSLKHSLYNHVNLKEMIKDRLVRISKLEIGIEKANELMELNE